MGDRGHESGRYRTVLDTVPDMFYVLDSDFHFEFVNDALVDVAGHDRAELIGAHASLLFDEEGMEKAAWNRDRLQAGEVEFGRMETKLETADDECIPCEIRGRFVEGYDGDGRGWTAGVIRNITERKARERQLQAHVTAMKASIDGMAILYESDEYVFVNQAHADIYGYDSPDAFIGESWHMCYEDDVASRFENDIMPKLFEHGSWRGEVVGLREDGSTFPQELSLSLTDDGRSICVVRDITERKQREQKLRQQNERLEEFASVVSHDLRNPLNVAQGRLDLVRDQYDSDHLDAAAAAIDRSLTLVDDLLTLAQQGEQITDIQPVALGTIVDDCWRNVRTRTANLVVNTDRRIRADPSRLKQLLENLLRNAVEHGDDDVAVTVGDIPNGFYVEDGGPGIPSDERDAVFDAGYSTATTGTGFGLSIVREIAEAHGWTVQVTEGQSGGARFEIIDVELVE